MGVEKRPYCLGFQTKSVREPSLCRGNTIARDQILSAHNQYSAFGPNGSAHGGLTRPGPGLAALLDEERRRHEWS